MSNEVTALSSAPFVRQVSDADAKKEYQSSLLTPETRAGLLPPVSWAPRPCITDDYSSSTPATQLVQLRPVSCGLASQNDRNESIPDDTRLAKAFADARIAFTPRGSEYRELIWQALGASSQVQVSLTEEYCNTWELKLKVIVQERRLDQDSSINGPRKRHATPAGLQLPGHDRKKQKIGSTAARVQASTVPTGRASGRLTAATLTALQQPRMKPTQLRMSNPVQTPIWLDVWENILRFCPLSYVLKIEDVSPGIQCLLSGSALWKEIRLRTFGLAPDGLEHPNPPSGMHERKYADLLAGTGCETKGCSSSVAKTWWAFQHRWCVDCLRRNTIQVCQVDWFWDTVFDDLSLQLKEYAIAFRRQLPIFDCIPCARFNEYNVYKGVMNDKLDPSFRAVFLRADIAKFSEESERAINEFGSDLQSPNAALQTWIDEKMHAKGEIVEQLTRIEKWMFDFFRRARSDARALKDKKRAFFAEKSRQMDPLLQPRVLEKSPCFQRAIASKTAQSEKSWNALQERLIAEAAANGVKRRKPGISNKAALRMAGVASSRRGLRDKLARLADKVIARLVESPIIARGNLPYGDYVRVVLHRVHKSYHEAKEPDDTCLLMDDACFVYEDKIKPFIASQDSEEKKLAMSQLRCPGCKRGRPQDKKIGDFPQLMQHIFEKHAANDVEESQDRLIPHGSKTSNSRSLPWIHYSWPPSLPILAAESEVCQTDGTKTPIPYFNAISLAPATEFSDVPGAFDGRMADIEVCPWNASDLTRNIVFAAAEFTEPNMLDVFKTKIALEFGLRLFNLQREMLESNTILHTASLEDLQGYLFDHGIGGIFENLRCLSCCKWAIDNNIMGYHARSGKSLLDLRDHYDNSHKHGDWTQDLLHLPHAQDLAAYLSLPCNTAVRKSFTKLFPIDRDPMLPQTRQGADEFGMTWNNNVSNEESISDDEQMPDKESISDEDWSWNDEDVVPGRT